MDFRHARTQAMTVYLGERSGTHLSAAAIFLLFVAHKAGKCGLPCKRKGSLSRDRGLRSLAGLAWSLNRCVHKANGIIAEIASAA
jgi:hypothetical protein